MTTSKKPITGRPANEVELVDGTYTTTVDITSPYIRSLITLIKAVNDGVVA